MNLSMLGLSPKPARLAVQLDEQADAFDGRRAKSVEARHGVNGKHQAASP
jgi:hypothetical protein